MCVDIGTEAAQFPEKEYTIETFVAVFGHFGNWGEMIRWKRSQEKGGQSQEKGGRSQEKGGRSQEKGGRSQEKGGRSQEKGGRGPGGLPGWGGVAGVGGCGAVFVALIAHRPDTVIRPI